METKDHQLAEKWKKQIELWQESDSTIASWCCQHNLNYHQFIYWKKRFADEKKPLVKKDEGQFIKIEEESSGCAGISIESQGLTVQLAKEFDDFTLERLIRLLRKG